MSSNPTPNTCGSTEFYKYFKENMEALGLPAPKGWFATKTSAVSIAGGIATAIKTFGARVTMGELIKAGVITTWKTAGAAAATSEALLVLGGLSASFYLGAIIGSLAVATGKILDCKIDMKFALSVAQQGGIQASWLSNIISQNNMLKTGTTRSRRHFKSLYAV